MVPSGFVVALVPFRPRGVKRLRLCLDPVLEPSLLLLLLNGFDTEDVKLPARKVKKNYYCLKKKIKLSLTCI